MGKMNPALFGRGIKRSEALVLLGINIGLVASSILSLWISHSVSAVLAYTCGVIGGVTLYARVKIWKNGKIIQLYNLVRDNEKAAQKMRNTDFLFWASAGFNALVFIGFLLK